MTNHFEGLEKEWDEVEQINDKSDFIIYPWPINSDKNSVYWPSDRGYYQFLEIAKNLEKKILYAGKRTFETTDIESLLAGTSVKVAIIWPDNETNSDDLDPSIVPERDDPEIIDFIQDATTYIGRINQFTVEWVHDGIIHTFWRLADWYSYLIDEVTDLQIIIEQRLYEEANNRDEELDVISRTIAKDKDFQSRPNKQLRVEFIKVSFPLLKPHEVYKIERSAWFIYKEEILPKRERSIVDEAVRLHKSGISYPDIGNKLGMTRGKLQRLINKYTTLD